MKHVIGVGDLHVSASREDVLVTYALGPCLGVAAWDAVAGVGGLLHCQLPLAGKDPRAATQPALFVDSGLIELFSRLSALGGALRRFEITVAGGAQILDDGALFRVGERNYTVFRKLLWKNNLLIRAADVGGQLPRTMALSLAAGEVTIQSAGQLRHLGNGAEKGRAV